jgi:two-component system NtrC family sensor kinase
VKPRKDKDKKEKKDVIGFDLSMMRPFMEGLLKNMEGGIFAIDLNKNIIFFTKSAEWITGYCLDEVLGKQCCEIFKSETCDDGCPFDKVIKKNVPVHLRNVTIIGKYGLKIVTSRSFFRLDDVHGNIRGIAVIFRDITELQNLRQQVLQSEKLAVMGQLAAGVAHEINNPINGIITYLHLMLKQLEEKKMDPEVWKNNLRLVERETVRIGRLVRNLLNFSRKTEPESGPVNLKRLLDETIPVLDDQFLIKNIKVSKEYANDIPDVLADHSQLQQVVMNLLVNAIQAVDNGGHINIALAAEGTKGSECFVTLDIKDDGVGIPEEDLENIFDPFYTTKTGEKGGVGLGLSIARQIIRAHHGRIRIQSEIGKGTTVSIRLPTP